MVLRVRFKHFKNRFNCVIFICSLFLESHVQELYAFCLTKRTFATSPLFKSRGMSLHLSYHPSFLPPFSLPSLHLFIDDIQQTFAGCSDGVTGGTTRRQSAAKPPSILYLSHAGRLARGPGKKTSIQTGTVTFLKLIIDNIGRWLGEAFCIGNSIVQN